MLSHISIRGLAIIDELDVEFSSGLNVITGETGAGKSILIKALTLLLGGKANADQVRQGKNQAVVTGAFSIPGNHPAISVIRELGLSSIINPEQPDLILRRQLSVNGRSQCWINDTPVTVQALTTIGTSLLDIFGQHENQKLLDVRQHVHYLDLFLADEKTLLDYQNNYTVCKHLITDLRTTIEQIQAWSRERDYWAFRLQELENFQPSTTDFSTCTSLCQEARATRQRQDGLLRAQAIVDEGVGGKAISSLLWALNKQVTRAQTDADPALIQIMQTSQDIAQKLDDLSYSIAQSLKEHDVDDEKLEQAQERLATYQELFRKLGVNDAEQLTLELCNLQERMRLVEQAEKKVTSLVATLLAACNDALKSSEQLAAARTTAFARLKKLVESELRDLVMPDAKLALQRDSISKVIEAIDLNNFPAAVQNQWTSCAEILSTLSSNGNEKVQFLMAANRGEASLPLQKVASGGEVARIMLALKRALSIDAQTCVLVFDEIDTGISGKVADIVGAKLADLARKFQVLCISHLPQVAAHAATHLKVAKSVKSQRTESTIVQLSAEESTQELARLLSGKEVTKSSLEHARTLREKAQTAT